MLKPKPTPTKPAQSPPTQSQPESNQAPPPEPAPQAAGGDGGTTQEAMEMEEDGATGEKMDTEA